VAGSFVVCTASAQTHNFSIAPEISSYEYKEPGVMKVSGTMSGVTAEYLNNGGVGRIKESMPIQLRARLTYMQSSNLDYDGGWFDNSGNSGPLKHDGVHQSYYDTVFAGGFGVKATEKLSISPYLGFGYRYLVDKDDGIHYGSSPFGPVAVRDYKREQTYYYLPLGADFKISMGSGWKLAFNTELDILLRGENKSHLGGADGTLKFRQNSGYGLRASVKVEKNLQSVGVFAEPFYRYWNISESNVNRGYIEPKNKTNEFGLRAGFSF
jgi:hypothetical protein